jgi:hypothetical protein
MNKQNQLQSDRDLIARLGGPTTLAKRLGFNSKQRVHNWLTRGIPPAVKLTYPKIFLKKVVKK